MEKTGKDPNNIEKQSKFVRSFNAAIEGLIYVARTERNMRIHFLAGFAVILLAIYLNFNSRDLLLLCFAITSVLAAEMVNTVVELTIDMIQPEYHPVARIIKDVSAGAVLVIALNSSIVGYVLFSKNLPFKILEDGLLRIKQSSWHLTFLSTILVLAFTIFGKIIFHRGTPLRGGMPSGHAAFAFSMWTAIAFLTQNSTIIILSFIMAFLIARHRIKDSIHTFGEVAAGGLIGVLVTTMVFQLLR